MNVFNEYSKYYDLLYKDKDYAQEAEYVHRLIAKYMPNASSIIDFGCGTGSHADLLSRKGFELDGVDISRTMLTEAEKKHPSLRVHHGDIRQIRLSKKVDVVASLFHVISYQQTNEDVLNAFKTAKEHLVDGGILIFDCWYGPAVLTERPVMRLKKLEDEFVAITRIAEPVMIADKNIVEVNYHMFVQEKSDGSIHEVNETHIMRYFFGPEIQSMLEGVGLKMINGEEWMTGRNLNFDTWNACYIAKK